MTLEEEVARHYGRAGLEQAILDALAASGKDIDRLAPSDLSGADEFHLGWRAATAELARALAFAPAMHVLDIGCGIGGPARHVADLLGCRVTGIDLSAEFVQAGNALTRRCGLADRVLLQEGSALALPFADATFDGAFMVHVGMNIADKARLFAEARRTLKAGARFGVYDIMRARDGALPYPLPWAASAETSFVATAEDYRSLLRAAGFAIESERDRSTFVRDLARMMREKAEREGPPPLSLHVLMGPATQERLGNVMRALESGLIAPTEIIARAN